MQTHLKTEQIHSESLLMRRSNDPQGNVDNGHVTAFYIFTIFAETFPHVDQPQCLEHCQYHVT